MIEVITYENGSPVCQWKERNTLQQWAAEADAMCAEVLHVDANFGAIRVDHFTLIATPVV